MLDTSPLDLARHLYLQMPGAPKPPALDYAVAPDGEAYLELDWPTVEETPAFAFCLAIARAIRGDAFQNSGVVPTYSRLYEAA